MGGTPMWEMWDVGCWVKLHDPQVSREAKRNGARDGWRSTTDLNTVAPRNATVAAKPRVAPSIPSGLAGANRVCSACDSEFGGHLKKCVSCGKQTHELCGTVVVQHKFHSYMCVCLVCYRPLTVRVVKCAQCTRTAHAHCTTAVGDDVHCKVCASPPPPPPNRGRRRLFRQQCASPPPPPPNRGRRRLFRQQWQKGRPWLKYINNLMHCAACWMYPQPGGFPEWAQGTNNFSASAVKKHERTGPHHVALAMWVSNGQKSSALGTLPPRGEERGFPAGFPGDLSMIELSGGNVLPGYSSWFSACGILAAIAVPFRNTQGTIIQSAEYLALASDSATDTAAHKAELVYYRTMYKGKPRTAFLSCQALPNGTASGIFSSYKRAFTAAGLEVTDWIPKLVWYCAGGATVTQGRQEGVYALLRDLQQEIYGWSVVVPIHANCHHCEPLKTILIALENAFEVIVM